MTLQKKIGRKIFALSANFFFIASQFSGTPLFAQPLTLNETQELRPVVAVQLPATGNQQPVMQIPSGSAAPESAPLSAATEVKPAFEIVTKLPRKYEDTNQARVSYNVEKGSLVLYTEGGPKKFERRVVDLPNQFFHSNSDIVSVRISDDLSSAHVLTPSGSYQLRLDDIGTWVEREQLSNQIGVQKNPTSSESVLNSYSLAIPSLDITRIQRFKDGTYQWTIWGRTYQSNSSEIQIETGIYRCEISDDGILTAIEQSSSRSAYFKRHELEIIEAGQYRLKKFIYHNVWEDGDLRDETIIFDYAKSKVEWKIADQSTWNYTEKNKIFYFDSVTLNNIVAGSRLDFDKIEDVATVVFDYGAVQSWNLESIRVKLPGVYPPEEFGIFKVFDEFDITQSKVESLSEINYLSVKALLKDDQIIYRGPVSKVIPSDGAPSFSVYRALIGGMMFEVGSSGTLPKHAEFKNDGTITLSVLKFLPNEIARHVYDVQVDAMGNVALELKESLSAPSLKEYQSQITEIGEAFFGLFNNSDTTIAQLMLAESQLRQNLNRLDAEGKIFSDLGLSIRISMLRYAISKGAEVFKYWSSSRDSQGEWLRSLNVEKAQSNLDQLRSWVLYIHKQLASSSGSSPSDFVAYDAQFLAHIAKIEDRMEEVVIGAEYIQIADTLASNAAGLSREQLEARLSAFLNKWKILSDKALSWNLLALISELELSSKRLIDLTQKRIAVLLPEGLQAGEVYLDSNLENLLRKYAPSIKPEDLKFSVGLLGQYYVLTYSGNGQFAIAYGSSVLNRPAPQFGVVYYRSGQPELRYEACCNLLSGLKFLDNGELAVQVNYGGQFPILDSMNTTGQITRWSPDDSIVPIVSDPSVEIKSALRIEKWSFGGINLAVTFESGGHYVLEYSSDLLHWQALKEYEVTSASHTNFWDANGSEPARFYRIRKV